MVKISPISIYSTKANNLALLAKLNWRIIKVPNSLWVHGLREVLNSRRTPFFSRKMDISGPVNIRNSYRKILQKIKSYKSQSIDTNRILIKRAFRSIEQEL